MVLRLDRRTDFLLGEQEEKMHPAVEPQDDERRRFRGG
jgi:hypothetical protein